MTTERRLETVERELVDLRDELARGVTTRVVVFVDENGKPRAWLGVDKDGARLILRDENGKGRAGLVMSKDGPRVGLVDENGKLRAELRVDKDGPRLELLDEKGKPIWKAP